MATIPDTQDTARACYAMAYFVLPDYFTRGAEALADRLSSSPLECGTFYIMGCTMRGLEPQMDLLHSFPVHRGDLNENTRYCIVEYPTPPALDLSDLSMEEMLALSGRLVLAPYFSAVLWDRTGAARYYVLGQSPDGFTTFRKVEPDMNANLGPGCEPALGAFVDLLRERAVPEWEP
jgi:hypothetical protein